MDRCETCDEFVTLKLEELGRLSHLKSCPVCGTFQTRRVQTDTGVRGHVIYSCGMKAMTMEVAGKCADADEYGQPFWAAGKLIVAGEAKV